MDIQEFKDALDRLDDLYEQQGYESAFKLVQELLTYFPYSVELLVKYAKLIQLIDKDDISKFPPLGMALESLKQAHLIAPHAIEPCIELGYFEYAVNDCPGEAVQYFNESQKNAESSLKEALVGQIKCYVDLDNKLQAREILEKAKLFFPNDSEIGVLELELEA